MSDHMPSVPVCPHCGTALPEFAGELGHWKGACRDLERKNAHLKGELTKVQGGGSDAKDIEELHDEWLAPRLARPGRKAKLGDDRKKAYRKLLKEYGKDDALKVIKQSAKTPYLVFGKYAASPSRESERARELRDDITKITATGDRVEQLLAMYDGDDAIPAPATGSEQEETPRAHRLHNPGAGWTPINRATTALRREAGWDTVEIEWSETNLIDDWPKVLRYHGWCPLHPTYVGLRLWEGDDHRVRAECDGACAEQEIVRAIFALEEKQVRRVEALLAFDRVANPQTLDKVVKALEIRQGDSRYKIGRKMGVHDDEALGLHTDPLEAKWAA